VTARVGCDEQVLLGKLIAPGINPILGTATAAVQKEQRIARTLRRVVHVDAV